MVVSLRKRTGVSSIAMSEGVEKRNDDMTSTALKLTTEGVAID